MSLLNFSTILPPEQTIAEISQALMAVGADAMMTEYDSGRVSAVSFRLTLEGKPVHFKLPCNWRAVREVFNEQGLTYVRHKDKNLDNQSVRTAWRIIKVWVDAQLALVEVNMVTVTQVFLPYAVTKNGATLYEHLIQNQGLLLGEGK